MPSVYGARLTTFEDAEKESEYGYVRKVRTIFFFFDRTLCDWTGCWVWVWVRLDRLRAISWLIWLLECYRLGYKLCELFKLYGLLSVWVKNYRIESLASERSDQIMWLRKRGGKWNIGMWCLDIWMNREVLIWELELICCLGDFCCFSIVF